MKKQEDTYYEAGVIVHHNGTTRVLRPILTEEERERRMNNIKKAATRFMQHVYEVEERLKQEESETGEQKKGPDKTA